MFHNLSGYDVHLFIRELGAHTSDMEVIVKNKEDYISLSIKVPVDSYIDKNAQALHGLAPKCELINVHELIKKSTNNYVTLLPLENGINLNTKG